MFSEKLSKKELKNKNKPQKILKDAKKINEKG